MTEETATLTFEEKIKQLDSIAKSLEGELDLQTAIVAYEQGINLIKSCRNELDQADEKIRKLEEVLISEDGELATKPIS